MPGMNTGINDTNPTVVAAFKAALLHQGLLALAVLVVLALAWVSVREWLPSARAAAGSAGGQRATPEAAGRRLLRIGFGIVWIFDGILQAQSAMAVGMPSQVLQPAAASSPTWVQHVMNWAATAWSYHPIQAGAAAVWIQVGIGVWLVAVPAGRLSRLAGLVSVGWGLVVWVFGEAFGGILAPGLTVLFGAPGAVLFYCAAGALVALPEHWWRRPELGRRILAALGLFFVGMAVLQAWPGRGFWQGTAGGHAGTLASMVAAMSGTSQPHFLSSLVSSFASVATDHGMAVNLIAVIAIALIGVGLIDGGRTGRRRLLRPAMVLMIVFCLADWILIEDFGFFGGVGTDPNSMIPIALLGIGGYLALTRVPAEQTAPAPAVTEATSAEPAMAEPAVAAAAAVARDHGRPDLRRLLRAFGSLSSRTLLAGWAVVIVLIGAAPMAAAQTNRDASPIIAQAIDGSAAPLNFRAPSFALTDQNGAPVSLSGLHGKVVLLTFLDPVCTSDCPVIAQEFRAADELLGASARNVQLVAIAANPVYYSTSYLRAFDDQERLTALRNWLFLTGPLSALRQVWANYSVAAQILPAGGMVAHSDVAYVIDAGGRTRTELNFDPGPGTSTTIASFAEELATAARQALRHA
ncbi:MAG TPA: SCO family protein [Streptosporangiaceae bacterium]